MRELKGNQQEITKKEKQCLVQAVARNLIECGLAEPFKKPHGSQELCAQAKKKSMTTMAEQKEQGPDIKSTRTRYSMM